MPEDVATANVGRATAYVMPLHNATGSFWFSCTSADPRTCSASSVGSVQIPEVDDAKFKAAALCG